jgi:hypothetical protein
MRPQRLKDKFVNIWDLFGTQTKMPFPESKGKSENLFIGAAAAAEAVKHVAEWVKGKSVFCQNMRRKFFEIFALDVRKPAAFAAYQMIMPLTGVAVFFAEHPAGRLTFAAVKAAGKPLAFQLFEGAVNRRLTDGFPSFLQPIGDFERAVMPPALLFEKGENNPALLCHIWTFVFFGFHGNINFYSYFSMNSR